MNGASISDLTAFAAVAEHRSFRRAAETLGVSRSALSHSVKSLEGRLGARLLNRTTRSVAPTEVGEQLLRRLKPMLGDLDDMLNAVGVRSGEPYGVLRINAGEMAARWLLHKVAPLFLARYPRVSLDLVAEGRLVDIVAEGFDAGIRLAEAVPQDMVAVPLGGEVRFLAVASPSYVAEHGRPRTPDDLHSHRCIRYRLPSGKAYRWEFERRGDAIAIDAPGALTLDHNGLMIEAACLGLGIAFVPEPAARLALDDGRLVVLLEDWSPPLPGLALYYPWHRHVPAPLRAFIDVLREVGRS